MRGGCLRPLLVLASLVIIELFKPVQGSTSSTYRLPTGSRSSLAFLPSEPGYTDMSRRGRTLMTAGGESLQQQQQQQQPSAVMSSPDMVTTKGGKKQADTFVPMTALGAVVAASTTAVILRHRPVGGPSAAGDLPNRLLELSVAAAGGLLSSSCCVLQLVLNSLSIGCAGFAVLDRLRPFFLTLTFSSLAFKTWYYDIRLKRGIWRSVPTWLIALSLAFSPNAVRWLNRAGLRLNHLLLAPAAAGRGGSSVVSRTTYRMEVKGMKCEACAHGLKGELDQVQGVMTSAVFFSDGVVVVDGRDHDGRLLERVQDVMRRKSYEAVVMSPQQERGGQPQEGGSGDDDRRHDGDDVLLTTASVEAAPNIGA